MRIMVVEDHVQTGKLLSRLLKLRGHNAEHAASAEDAQEMFSQHPFDIVICDIGLPDISGWELIARLRQHLPDLAAIALSGYGGPEDIRRSLDAGFREHLVKPVSLEMLDAAVLRVMSSGTGLGGTNFGGTG
jgi:two-component system CheB/CheR fusion protein